MPTPTLSPRSDGLVAVFDPPACRRLISIRRLQRVLRERTTAKYTQSRCIAASFNYVNSLPRHRPLAGNPVSVLQQRHCRVLTRQLPPARHDVPAPVRNMTID
jgi:hypothetical protein